MAADANLEHAISQLTTEGTLDPEARKLIAQRIALIAKAIINHASTEKVFPSRMHASLSRLLLNDPDTVGVLSQT